MPVTLYNRQRQILDFIAQFIQRNGYSPTLQEIAGALGVSSLATVHEHLQALVKKKVIRKFEGAVRGLEIIEEKTVSTPFGEPSDKVLIFELAGREIAFLPRHGKGHRFSPSTINYRANVCAMKMLGVEWIVSVSAVGSLKEEIAPGDFVIVDQFIDRTTKRKSTFYEKEHVCHIPMAEPFCSYLRNLLAETAKQLGLRHHKKGTVITIEGPRFSTKAESSLFRQWNADVINMSTVPEVVLAREAGICYASVAMSTDYDCWHQSEEEVNIGMVLQIMKKNAENVKKLIIETIPKIKDNPDCRCRQDIKGAVIS